MFKKIIIMSLFLFMACNLFALNPTSKLEGKGIKDYIYSEKTIIEMTETVKSIRSALVSAGEDDWDTRSNFEDFLNTNKDYFQNLFFRIFKRYYYIMPNDKIKVSYLGFGFYKHAILIEIKGSKFVLKFTKKNNPQDIENEFNIFIALKEPRIYLRGRDFIVEDFIGGQSFSNYLLQFEDDNNKTILAHKMFLRYIIDSYCKTVELVNNRIMGLFIADFNPKNFILKEDKLICIDGGNSGKMNLSQVLNDGNGDEAYDVLSNIMQNLECLFGVPKQQTFVEALNMFYDNFKNNPALQKEFIEEINNINFHYVSFNKYFKFSNIVKLFMKQPEIIIDLKYNGFMKNAA